LPAQVHKVHDAIKKENPEMSDSSAWAIAYAQYNKEKKSGKSKNYWDGNMKKSSNKECAICGDEVQLTKVDGMMICLSCKEDEYPELSKGKSSERNLSTDKTGRDIKDGNWRRKYDSEGKPTNKMVKVDDEGHRAKGKSCDCENCDKADTCDRSSKGSGKGARAWATGNSCGNIPADGPWKRMYNPTTGDPIPKCMKVDDAPAKKPIKYGRADGSKGRKGYEDHISFNAEIEDTDDGITIRRPGFGKSKQEDVYENFSAAVVHMGPYAYILNEAIEIDEINDSDE
jgi:hypothetical protein